ncbi:biotin/lipoyl-containing protein, partial [Dermatophilus congolensis]|uniref:biotin/lipoyl-containing protein n=1 Tax=Dermatophilus congolensis TaxID=1863 RepID=UPI003C7AF570
MYQFTMPDIGEGTHETEITKWFVAEGDTITEDSILVEVESDKVAPELPCPVTFF